MTDDRPEIEADMFSYRELPANPADCGALWREMGELMRERGATWFRMTIVSPEYPKPPYPDGLYLEGWMIEPERMEIPSRSAPFNFPLTAAEPA